MDERLQYDIEEAVHKIGVLNDKHNIGLTEKGYLTMRVENQ